VQPGDVITAFDGKDVPEMRRLPLMVAETEVGKTVNMTVFRKGGNVTLKVKIGALAVHEDTEASADDQDQTEKPPAIVGEKVDDLGVSVSPLTETLRSRYDVKKDVNGLIVTNVLADGIAADQGIEAGDVISEAAQEEVKTPKELIDQVKAAKKDNKPLLLLVNRKDDLRFVAITFGKKK
jgi:serine protease Do